MRLMPRADAEQPLNARKMQSVPDDRLFEPVGRCQQVGMRPPWSAHTVALSLLNHQAYVTRPV